MFEDCPRVLNIKTMDAEESGVNVMRPSKWGNPFIIGIDGTREEVCDKFEAYVQNRPELIEQAKIELRGQNLICCCKLKTKDVRCHADTWLRIANETSPLTEDDY